MTNFRVHAHMFLLPITYSLPPRRQGAVSLAAMIIIGSVILEIGIASAVLVFLLTSGGLGARLSQDAYVAAQAGIQDALIRLVRNKDLCSAGFTCSLPQLVLGNTSVNADVSRDLASPSKYTIKAVGHALNKDRLLCAKAEADTATGLVTVVEVVEKELTAPSC